MWNLITKISLILGLIASLITIKKFIKTHPKLRIFFLEIKNSINYVRLFNNIMISCISVFPIFLVKSYQSSSYDEWFLAVSEFRNKDISSIKFT